MHMMKRSTAIIACVLVFLVTAGCTLMVCVPATLVISGMVAPNQAQPITAQGSSDLVDLALLEEISSLVEDQSIWAGDKDTRTYNAANAILYGEEDIYAEYFTAEQYQTLLNEREGNYVGIGVSVMQAANGNIVINEVYEGSPAAEAGLRPADIFTAVNGVSTYGKTTDDLVDVVRGEEGTEVEVTVLRGEEELTFTMVRRAVVQHRTSWKMLDGQIGYIRITSFEGNAAELFLQALDELQSSGARGYVLDLRNNPGGMQDIVEVIADVLVPEGPILSMVDKNDNVVEESRSDANWLNMPLVVLINENSASASELLAGNVKDYGVGTLVGVTTFGKGVAQSFYPLSNGGVAKLTANRYLTGGGNCPQGVGIAPDIEVELDEAVYEDYATRFANPAYDNQMAAALEELERLIQQR